ncbi:hypothetical protein [Prolixibacter denitrificans]|uniref:Uncharacterized protein n=1 Tax=Prolixibacter denitrificans TaxID=1541063 RepID=A0A2P8CG07_9BACT|nr:hypothetical protein [Prolixibacter denitrificans]PSK83829.1 hypothetical protein CLV93_103245 [Prolixibacter denitrificans]GET23371.1 hypothetical protein JCM18694_36170 [Prolixibacter denitrificans]
MAEIKFSIKYTGGKADEHKLDLYDAGASIHGLAKALAISTHALITEGEVRSKGDSIPNVKFYLHPPQKGSFVELVSVFFENTAVQVVGASVITAAFWDMIAYTWKSAVGKEYQPKERIPKEISTKNELFTQEIANVLERPLQQLHRPILHNHDVKIEIRRPRIGKIIEFDNDTLNYVYSKNEVGIQENISGNVTKYNILSGYGRFYDDEEGRTIPFNLSNDLSVRMKELLTWSLHNTVRDNNGKILLDAEVISDNLDNIKRYIIVGVKNYVEN